MNFRMHYFLMTFLCLVTITSVGQGLNNVAQRLVARVARNNMKDYNNSEKIEGTPYLNMDFIDGEVHSSKGKFTGLPLRYNIYEDQMEFEFNQVTYVLDPAPSLAKIAFANYKFIVAELEVKGTKKYHFLELLDSGKVTLVSQKVVLFKPREEPTAMQYQVKLARFDRLNDVLYYRVGNGALTKVSNLKKLISSLPDKKEEASSFAKTQNLSNTADDDIVALVKYYNSL